jgi:carbon-monoxide dehydrogenase large subunit
VSELPPNEFPFLGGARFTGARVHRVEDPRLLTGEALFTGDIRLPRMLAAAFVRSTEAHARIRSIDPGAALAVPGVHGVVTAGDIDAKPLDLAMEFVPGLARTPQPVLATEKVRFVGEPVAIILARDRYAAEDAADLVAVDYERLGVVTDVEAAATRDAPLLFEELGTNVLFDRVESNGDVDGAFGRADHLFKRTYSTNRFVASPIEGRAAVADYKPRARELTVWSGTQTPHLLRATLADVLALPEHRVRAIAPHVGGGFGQKMSTYPEEVAVAAAALAARRPVAWVEDRCENLTAATHAKEQTITLEAALASDGTILGLRATHVGDAGAYSVNSTSALIEPSVGARNLPGVFRFVDYEWRIVSVVTNRSPIGPFRAVGSTAGSSARDLFFAEIARALGTDVAEFLRHNMIRAEDMPFHMATGQVYDTGSYIESMDLALDMIDYRGFRRRQADARGEQRYLGVGIAPYVEATGRGTELSAMQGELIPSHDNASVSIDPSGKVTVATSVCPQGQGHETVFAQLAADVLGVHVDDVTVHEGDTATAPFGLGTWASRSAIIGGGATILAARDVRDRVLSIAARVLEAAAEDLTVGDGRVSIAGAPAQSISITDVAAIAHWDVSVRDDDDRHVLAASRF